jgi:hypothetical protein
MARVKSAVAGEGIPAEEEAASVPSAYMDYMDYGSTWTIHVWAYMDYPNVYKNT